MLTPICLPSFYLESLESIIWAERDFENEQDQQDVIALLRHDEEESDQPHDDDEEIDQLEDDD